MELYHKLLKEGFVPTLFFAWFPTTNTDTSANLVITIPVLYQQWKNSVLGSTSWQPVFSVQEPITAKFDEQVFE